MLLFDFEPTFGIPIIESLLKKYNLNCLHTTPKYTLRRNRLLLFSTWGGDQQFGNLICSGSSLDGV